MPLANEIFRGKARVSGSTFVADVVLYPIAESLKLGQEFEEDIVKDELGRDISWRAINQKYSGDVGLILIDKSTSSTAANAKAGAAFFEPYAIIDVTTCDCAAWVRKWQNISGASIDLNQGQIGKMSIRLRAYADAEQNALAVSTPT